VKCRISSRSLSHYNFQRYLCLETESLFRSHARFAAGSVQTYFMRCCPENWGITHGDCTLRSLICSVFLHALHCLSTKCSFLNSMSLDSFLSGGHCLKACLNCARCIASHAEGSVANIEQTSSFCKGCIDDPPDTFTGN